MATKTSVRKGSVKTDVGENQYGVPAAGKVTVHAHDEDMVIVEWAAEVLTMIGETDTAPRLVAIPRKAWEKFS